MFKKIQNSLNYGLIRAKVAMSNKKGEAYVGEAVKILIAVVIGAVLLVLLYTLFTNVIGVNISDTIKGWFDKADDIADNVGEYTGVAG